MAAPELRSTSLLSTRKCKTPQRLVSILCVLSFLLPLLLGCSGEDPLPPPPLPKDSALNERGQELVFGLAACGFCHSSEALPGAPLAGGRLMADKFGEIRSPNITPSKSGISGWSEDDVIHAFRAGKRPDESEIARSFHGGYEWMAEPDLTAIVRFIRAQRPIERRISRRDLSFVSRNTTGFFDSMPEVTGSVPDVSSHSGPEYGQYLVDHVARCGACHSTPGGLIGSDDYLAGGHTVSFDDETKTVPNITSSKTAGIGGWSSSNIRDYLKTGKKPDGRQVDSRFCPVRFYARASDADIDAVVQYLRSVTPLE